MFALLLKLVAFLTVFIDNNFMFLVRLGKLLFAAEVLHLEIIGVYVGIDCLNTFFKCIFV